MLTLHQKDLPNFPMLPINFDLGACEAKLKVTVQRKRAVSLDNKQQDTSLMPMASLL